MSSAPIINPELPYVGAVEGGLNPGLMVKVQGIIPPDSMRFAINYQLGPNLNPRDDIALHVSPRFNDGFITRNSIVSMTWGPEENDGPLWIKPGEPFEIIILCEYYSYKIAVNGRHFTEFAHRLPYQRVTHLVIDGQVEISSIFYEAIPIGPKPSGVGPPAPGGIYPTLPDPQENYGPPPGSEDYRNNPPHKQKSEEEGFSGLDKVGLAVGAAVAAGGVAAAMHAYNKNKKKHEAEGDYERSEATSSESGLGGLGALGAALASSLASNALSGSNAHAQQGYPPPQASNGGGFLGSILGAIAPPAPQAAPPSQDPLSGALGSILGGVLGQKQAPPPSQEPNKGLGEQLLGAAFESLSKRAFGLSRDDDESGGGGGGHYGGQPSGGYGGQPSGGYGGYGGHQQPPPGNVYGGYGGHQQPPSSNVYGGRHDDQPPQGRPPSPPAPGGGKLSAAEISRGLGLGDDDE